MNENMNFFPTLYFISDDFLHFHNNIFKQKPTNINFIFVIFGHLFNFFKILLQFTIPAHPFHPRCQLLFVKRRNFKNFKLEGIARIVKISSRRE